MNHKQQHKQWLLQSIQWLENSDSCVQGRFGQIALRRWQCANSNQKSAYNLIGKKSSYRLRLPSLSQYKDNKPQ